VALVNSYIFYKQWMSLHQEEDHVMSHYNFILAITLAWLDDKSYWPTRYRRDPRRDDDCRFKRNRTNNFKKHKITTRARRRMCSSTASTVSTIINTTGTDAVSCVMKQCIEIVTDESLDLACNTCRFLLQNTHSLEFTHLPVQATRKNSEYQLHRWAFSDVDWNRYKAKKQVWYCSECKIKLCMQCLKSFHNMYDLKALKNELKNSAF